MEKFSYQNLVLDFIKTHDLKFVFDRCVLFRGIAVGAIPEDGTFATTEIITGGNTDTSIFIPFNSDNETGQILPEVNWQRSEVIFPLIDSTGSKIIERKGIRLTLVESSHGEKNFNSTFNNNENQDSSLLNLSNNFIRVTSDSTLFRKLEQLGQWTIGHTAYFVIQLDLSGTEHLSMQYLDMKVKYVNFCQIGNFWIPEFMKMGSYFDKIYLSRETEIYKPLYEKFIKNNSTNLCP